MSDPHFTFPKTLLKDEPVKYEWQNYYGQLGNLHNIGMTQNNAQNAFVPYVCAASANPAAYLATHLSVTPYGR